VDTNPRVFKNPGPFVVSDPCGACAGQGQVDGASCAACLGTGVGRFFHGTKADLAPGDVIEPGHAANYGDRGRAAPFVYLTGTFDAAAWGAELAVGDARGRLYVVAPTGAIEDDPNLTNQRFPGNPTRSFRSRAPLRVVDEIVAWEGHAADAVAAMREGLRRLAEQGVVPID
jgi:rifampin ADP-ribosylating transferase